MSDPTLDRADLAQLVAMPAGRRFLWRVLEASGMYAAAYGTDGSRLAHSEGRRSLGLEIFGWLGETSPEAIIQIMTEALATQKETQRGNRNRSDLDTDPDARR